MITLTSPQTASLLNDVLTLATLYQVHRQDGVVFYLTDHDEELVLSGTTYSPVIGVQASAVQKMVGVQSRNHDILGVLSSDLITDSDLLAGKYQNATIVEMVVNWADILAGGTLGAYTTNTYWIDQVTFSGESWQATVVGLTDWIQQQVGHYLTRGCRWRLGGSGCNINLAPLILSTAVSSVTLARIAFTASSIVAASGYYSGGVLTWLSGLNKGLQFEIKDQVTTTITLWLKTPFVIAATDQFIMTPGCNHQITDCAGKFNNIINYGGFPFIPGTDLMIQVPNV